jgi:hypothetical protein
MEDIWNNSFKSRWGFVIGKRGGEYLTSKIYNYKLNRAMDRFNRLKNQGCVGCVYRQVMVNGEWVLVETMEIQGVQS